MCNCNVSLEKLSKIKTNVTQFSSKPNSEEYSSHTCKSSPMRFNRSKSSLEALQIFSLVMSISQQIHNYPHKFPSIIQRVGRFTPTDQQWWVIVNGSLKTFNYKIEGNYSDKHLISLVLYTCYSISHVACHPIWRGHPQSRDPWRHVKTHYISLCARLLTYQKQDFHWHLVSVPGATPARLPTPQTSLQNKAQYICVSYQLSVIAYARKKTNLKTLCPIHLQMYYSYVKLKFMIRYLVLYLYHQDPKDFHRIKITMMEEWWLWRRTTTKPLKFLWSMSDEVCWVNIETDDNSYANSVNKTA